MRYLFAVIGAFLFLYPSVCLSEIKEIIAEGAYNMGDGETPSVAESRALLQAKRAAAEQAGTYVESYSKIKNFELTEDEVRVLASSVMEITILEKKRTIIGNGFNFWVRINAKVSTDKVADMAKRVKEKSIIEDYKKIQAAYDESQKKIEELKQQLVKATSSKEKNNIETKIAADERLFQTNEWYEKGKRYLLNQEYDLAIGSFTHTLQIDAANAEAYIGRGVAYLFESNKEKAKSDFKAACDLKNESGCYNLQSILKKGRYIFEPL